MVGKWKLFRPNEKMLEKGGAAATIGSANFDKQLYERGKSNEDKF